MTFGTSFVTGAIHTIQTIRTSVRHHEYSSGGQMTRSTRSIVCVLALTFTLVALQPESGAAQTPQASKTAPVSLQAELLKDWTSLKTTMQKIAAEMPADKYTYKPTPGQQTFGERVVHMASANVYFLGLLGGSAPKPAIDSKDPKTATKEAAIKALDESFDYGIAVLKQQTDETLKQGVASPPQFLGPSSHARIMTFLVGHIWDIYGQMAVYLRLNGLVPPMSQKM
jgi:uncharacterized damage-inducible protein DinB